MITYTKLRDGSWGVRSTEALQVGQVVQVNKASGEVKQETIRGLVWTGNGVWLCSIEPRVVQAPARPARPSNWRPCGYPGCSPNYCDECDGDGAGTNRRRYY